MSDHHQPPEKDEGLQGAYEALAFDEDVSDAKVRVWAKVSSDVAMIAAAGTLGGFLGRGFELAPSLKAKMALAAVGLMASGAAMGIAVDRYFVRTANPEPVGAPDAAPNEPGPEPGPSPEPEPVPEPSLEPELVPEPGPSLAPEPGPEPRPSEAAERETSMEPSAEPNGSRRGSPPAERPAEDEVVTEAENPLPPSELARERTMIDAVRAAVRAGHSEEALRTIRRHEREFARGRLVEEREALRVVALARAGRTEEAQQRGRRFRSRYPRSLLLPLVESSLREENP